jgi:Rrf2 family cysteine metabolism transcriptional repressor
MKLSLRSEYALLTLIYLARHKENSLAAEISAAQHIPSESLAEILSVLSRFKYVKQAKGGFRLAKSADKTSVAEVIRLFDGALAPLELVSEKGYNPAPMEREEKLNGLFEQIQEQISERLETTSLIDLA